MSLILSLDPGVSTGYVLAEVEGCFCTVVDYGIISHNIKLRPKFEAKTADYLKLWELMDKSDVILCEDVVPGGRNFNLTPVYIIGVIQYFATDIKCDLYTRIPTLMKGPNKWGKETINKITPVHAQDAMAHLMAYLGPNFEYRV